MAVNLSPIWGAGAQLLDNSGNVLSGGKIYTYAAGTTTPATTYTSSTGITANSNPIILNSAGRVPYEIWLTDGVSYKFVLKDSDDTLIATYDNLSGINSNFIAYTAQQEIQTATAGQTVFNLTTMQYQPGTHNLAVYVDGVNQYGPGAMYAFVETDSDTVTFVSGLHVGASVKFTTASPVSSGSTDAQNVSFIGVKGQTGLVADLGTLDGSDWIGFQPDGTGAVSSDYSIQDKLRQTVSVQDFGAVGDGVTDDLVAFENAVAALPDGGTIYIPPGTYATNSFFELTCDNINFVGSGVGTVLKSLDTTTNSTGTGNHCTLYVIGNNCSISNLKIDGNKAAVDASVTRRDGVKLEGNNGIIENVTTVDTVSSGVFVYNGDGLSIKNCTVLNAGKNLATNNSFGIWCASATNVIISGNYVKTSLQSGIFSIESTYVSIVNNVVTDAENGIRLAPASPSYDAYSTITGNVVSDSSGDLIRFTGNYVTVSGNTCTGSTNGSGANSEGGICQTVTGNTFANNIQNGIRIGGSVTSTSKLCISGNTCYGNTGNGVYLVGGTGVSITDAIISGNMLLGNSDVGLRSAPASIASTAWIGTNNSGAYPVLSFTNWTYHNNTTRGENIVAASTIYVGDANLCALTGTSDITTIAGGIDNQEITLLFTQNATGSGVIEGSNIRLTTANFAYKSSSILKLANFNGTWYEVARAQN